MANEFRARNGVIVQSGSITIGDMATTGYTFPSTRGAASQLLQTDGSGNLSFATVSVTNDFGDNVFRISDNSDATKKIAFEASGIGSSQTRTITMPNSNVNLGLVGSAIQPGGNVSSLTNDAGYLTTAVTSVGTGTGLTGGPITATGTVALANTTVTPGSYTSADITVDAQGRLTAAANGSGGGGSIYEWIRIQYTAGDQFISETHSSNVIFNSFTNTSPTDVTISLSFQNKTYPPMATWSYGANLPGGNYVIRMVTNAQAPASQVALMGGFGGFSGGVPVVNPFGGLTSSMTFSLKVSQPELGFLKTGITGAHAYLLFLSGA